MDRFNRPRRNSFAALQPPASATVSKAPNTVANAPATRVLTEDTIRGFTQDAPNQLPTVYLHNPNDGAADGRVTQQHLEADNVGFHAQRKPEMFFGNISNQSIQWAKQQHANQQPPVQLLLAVQREIGHPPPENAGKHLVELFHNDEGGFGGAHQSRGSFQDLTGPGMREARLRVIHGLRKGPVSTDTTRNLSAQNSGARDDWNL